MLFEPREMDRLVREMAAKVKKWVSYQRSVAEREGWMAKQRNQWLKMRRQRSRDG
jgi:hypothetical protein